MRGQTKVPIKFRLWDRDIDQNEFEKGDSFLGSFDTEYYKQHALTQNPKIGQTMEEAKGQEIVSPKTGSEDSMKGEILSPGNTSELSQKFNQEFSMSAKKLDKYNQKEKLEKEEKNMENSSAKLIVGNDKQGQANLIDFKIIKVIDKGSFGKVFLVVNKHTGQLFAMKRINKDILINKK